MGTPEAPTFDPQAFDADFFDGYQKELADISFEDQASAALANILTIEKADGTQKTYQEIRDESHSFFNSEWVRQSEAVMDRMTAEFAMACMGHPHGSELAQDEALSPVFGEGLKSLYDDHTRDHDGHKHSDSDGETDPKTGKKKKKTRLSWLDILNAIYKSTKGAKPE